VAPLAVVDGFYVRFNASSEPKGENDGNRSATFREKFGSLVCFSRMRITSINFIPSREVSKFSTRYFYLSLYLVVQNC
jgi:hypothetical protein